MVFLLFMLYSFQKIEKFLRNWSTTPNSRMCTMLNDSEMTLPQSDTVASAIQFQSVSTLCYSNPLLSFHARLLSNELTVLHGSTMCIFKQKNIPFLYLVLN